MKIKEILPFTIESPVIHLVQPSPTIPLGHEVVFQQSLTNGGGVNPIYALAAQEKRAKRQRRARLVKQKEFIKKEESALSCGFISPPIHQESDERKKRKTSFYDLRNSRSMSIAVENPVTSPSPTLYIRSKSLDESPIPERRKVSPDFEEILRELGCTSRNSDAGESTTSKASSGGSESGMSKSELTREGSVASNDSVFYDISLDNPEIEKSHTCPPVAIKPRKSFSEETFNRSRSNIDKQRNKILEKMRTKWRTISSDSCDESYDEAWNNLKPHDKRRVSQMVDDLLMEIYGEKTSRPVRRRSCTAIMRGRSPEDSHYDSLFEDNTCGTEYTSGSESFRLAYLQRKGISELTELVRCLQADVKRLGGRLVKQLIRRDCLIAKRDWHCDWITAYLQANSEKRSEDTKTRFSVAPSPGDSGFTQWQNGMRMVARLPEGIPPQFRKTLWLNLAEKHLASRGVQWDQVEDFCFNEFTNPDDEELGVQIVKDVHRTGCSLFCGVSGTDNQALLKRVLLAYARWNKAVGYCQGFNMLAALILQVMDKSEVDSVKVMIYLIEGVLPESYFANNLRGLSVDMAVFRDLLRIKLPTLSRHFDQLQCESKDSGTSYEPPLTNVFTMQWFLTLFCNCLPQDTVLRVWDLIFLEGNHILLSTALAIWSTLSDRIMSVESADEFYCIMGVLTREMLEFGLMDANALIKAIVSFNLPELPELREKYLYNITPWTQSVSTVARRGLRLFYSDDDTDTEEDDEKIAIATAYGLFRSPKRKDGASGVTSPPRALSCPDKDKIAMDISALTKQYRKLRERQKQAHVILTAACGSQSLVGPTTSPAMNHLLMGKFALVNNKGRRLGPPPGSIPPPSQPRTKCSERHKITISGETLHWKDAVDGKKTLQRDSDDEKSPERSSRRSSSSSTSTELCDDPQRSPSDSEDISDAFLPSETEPATPLKSVQPKVQHPSDVIICKEEDEDELGSNKSDKQILKSELKEGGTEDNIISPGSDDDKSQQKRKLSFRIDPEELRQLDRKLSLKIVEIERRKSSAGIDSEDLNSKVLFPFDRDYIQEKEKCDRDTPSSIPDDRMCSTEEYISGFEEETILVPDIITTHKPLGYRMESLEECDETKAINDETDYIPEETQEENKADYKLSVDSESLDKHYGQDEDHNTVSYTGYNFDELFTNKNNDNCKEHFEQTERTNKLISDQSYSEDKLTKISIAQKNEVHTSRSTLSSMQISDSAMDPSNISTDTIEITGEQSSHVEKIENQDTDIKSPGKSISTQHILHLSDDMKASLVITVAHEENISSDKKTNGVQSVTLSKNIVEESDNHSENSLLKKFLQKSSSSEELEVQAGNSDKVADEFKSTQQEVNERLLPNLSDSQKVFEKRLANLLPGAAIFSNLDSSTPDVAAVASRESCINLIREKYATFGQSSKDEYVDIKPSTIGINVSNLYHTEKENECPLLMDSNIASGPMTLKFVSQEEILKTGLSSTDISKGELQSSESKDIEIPENITNETLQVKEEEIKQPEDGNKRDEFIKQPSSVLSSRRGSEVALNLILQENSQILSKIQQQSRRSSEISFDSKSDDVKFTKTDFPMKNYKEDQKSKEENSSQNINFNCEEEFNKLRQLSENFLSMDINNLHTSNQISECHDVESSDKMLQISSNEILISNVSWNISECAENNNEDINIPTKHSAVEHQESLKITNTTKSDEPAQVQPLPDVCKFDSELILSLKYGRDIRSVPDKYSPYPPRLNTENFDNTEVDYNKRCFKKASNCIKRSSIMSPTTELEENSPSNGNPSLKSQNILEDKSFISLTINHEQKQELPTSTFSIKENVTPVDNLSDTNEDIIKELRALDIKPEEVLEFPDRKTIPITPNTPNDEYLAYKKDFSTNESYKFRVFPEEEKYYFQKSPKLSFDLPIDPKECKQTAKREYKGTSFDADCLSRSEYYLTEKPKPITRASTVIDDDHDDSLYLNSYKSHGRLLIEKGELDPYRTSESPINTSCYSDRKPLVSSENNSYDLKDSCSSNINKPFSEFSLERSKSPHMIKPETREKMLCKYKSEDYERSISPPHYRFSSASPVRKKLDTLSSETPISPYSSLNRVKSPSPTYFGSSQSLTAAESSSFRYFDKTDLDSSYRSSREFKKYSRTESLDLNPSESKSAYLKKRTESLDITMPEKIPLDKKSPSSPLKFNPFPVRSSSRQPKELGVKLGLYLPPKSDKSPSKRLT